MRRSAWITILGAVAAQTALVSTAEAGPNDATVIGVVRDATSGEGVQGAVVVITGEKLQGERVRTTDASGLYRVPNLPPGTYEVSVIHKDYNQGQKRTGLQLRAGTTVRFDVSLVASGVKDTRTIIVDAPTIDVVSSSTGLAIDKEMARRVPIAVPTGKGAANRSFEAIAEATPGARNDTYGTSVAGTTSPENKYYVDGLSVNDPGFGLNGTGLSVEFVEEVKVEAGGYMPEYGRATGGIVNAVTKSGSNEFHGGVWGFYTPGQLQGQIKIPRREGQTIVAERNLSWLGDAGFDIGGRLIKDKLWFYGGVSVSRTVYNITTSWNRRVVDPVTGNPLYNDPVTGKVINDKAVETCKDSLPKDTSPEQAAELCDPSQLGFSATERVAGTTNTRKAQGTTVQALGKLTYTPATNHTLELLGIYAPSVSGGNGTFGLDARTGQPEVVSAAGDYTALAHRYKDSSSDLQLKWNATSADHKWNVDTTVGWHHQINDRLGSDGSRIGDKTGLAATPGVIYRRNNPDFHPVTDFPKAAGAGGAPAGSCDPYYVPDPMDPNNPDAGTRTNVCPVQNYATGGPGFMYERSLDRAQARSMATRLAQGAGHHLIKFGIDFEYMRYVSNRGYSGGTLYRESTNGATFSDNRQYAFLSGPDDATILNNLKWTTYSTTIGGFLQDSWSIMDKVTLNAGLRYDAQHMFGGDGQLAVAMPNQLSPRVGLIWDPTQAGHAKLFINYARFYQSIPLNLADRAGSGEPQLASVHDAAFCDPTKIESHVGACRSDDPRNRVTVGGPTSPDQKWILTGAGKTPIDPKLKPQSSDEIVAGAEYEIFANGRLGVNYTHRWLTRVIEDMSRDEAQTYFIGNPGYGIAKDFPKATRVYDALIVYLDKRFSRNFLVSGSYTASWLRGNMAGLFRPETGQLDPNINSDFDLQSLLLNRTGYLPGDTRHVFKIFMAGEIPLRNNQGIQLGGSLRAASGTPTSYLGSHFLYGPDEAFILPRGSGPRLPWTFRIDTNIGYRKMITKDLGITITMDVFNVANFQQVIAVDQSYTFSDVAPIKTGGTIADLKNDVYGAPVVKNPNFGNPIAYQQPRLFRFGIRLTF